MLKPKTCRCSIDLNPSPGVKEKAVFASKLLLPMMRSPDVNEGIALATALRLRSIAMVDKRP